MLVLKIRSAKVKGFGRYAKASSNELLQFGPKTSILDGLDDLYPLMNH